MWLALIGGLALAQDAQPPINAQLYRPPIAARRTLWANDSQPGPDRQLTLQAWTHLAHEPLVYVWEDERTSELLRDVWQLDLAGGWTRGPVRIGLQVPVILRASGALGGQTGLGDVTADVKVRLRDGSEGGLGVAVAGRLPLPTSTVDGLGGRALSWDLEGIVDGQVGRTLLVANAGLRWAPGVRLEDLRWGPAAHLRLGAGHELSPGVGLSSELAAQWTLSDPLERGALPAEALVGGWSRVSDHVVLRGGVGWALTAGVGAPQLRGVLGVEWRPGAQQSGPAEPTARPQP